jgi:hypothetical protein
LIKLKESESIGGSSIARWRYDNDTLFELTANKIAINKIENVIKLNLGYTESIEMLKSMNTTGSEFENNFVARLFKSHELKKWVDIEIK